MAAIDDPKCGGRRPAPLRRCRIHARVSWQGTINEQPCATCHGTGVQRSTRHEGRPEAGRPDQAASPNFGNGFG